VVAAAEGEREGATDVALMGAPLLGRTVELAELLRMLDEPESRLVSITGRSGVGKTRLALEVVRRLVVTDPRAAVAVPLATVHDPELLVHEIAHALGVVALPGGSLLEPVAQRIGPSRLVLVLDNLEHILGAASTVQDLLGRCPGLRILVTTQAPLRLRAERIVRLEPLRVPAPGVTDPARVAVEPAVELFCDRVGALDARFRLDDHNAADVAELCRELEGLPLAIELAAARAANLPVRDVLRRLADDRLNLLRGAYRGTPRRHHDLRSAIAWTCALLDDADRQLFERLSVIDGSFDVDDVEALSVGTNADPLDALSMFIDLHLVDPVIGSDPPRFVLPGSIRDFGTELSEDSSSRVKAEEIWLRWCAQRARDAALGIDSIDNAVWWDWLASAHEALLDALETCLAQGRAAESVDLLSALAPYWSSSGYFSTHAGLLDDALALAEREQLATAALAEVLAWSCSLLLDAGTGTDDQLSRARLCAGEALARSLGDDHALLHALRASLLDARLLGNQEAVLTRAEEGLDLARRGGDATWTARFEVWAGMLTHLAGDHESGLALGRAGLARARRVADERTVVVAFMFLAPLAHGVPAIVDELPPPDEVVALSRRTGETRILAVLLPMLAGIDVANGEVDSGLRRLAQGLELVRSLPSSPLTGYNLLTTVSVASAFGEPEAAARFHGMTRAMFPLLAARMAPAHVDRHHKTLDHLRTVLGSDEFEEQADKGSCVDWASGVDEALALCRFHDPVAPAPVRQPVPGRDNAGPLTDRQLDVVRLLAAGLSNKEIAQRLSVTPKTVMHHTTTIYRKLGVRGRGEATAWAIRTGLA
jgi:predicted ATPase/DNA-binding CsgD family transcriptional regulator